MSLSQMQVFLRPVVEMMRQCLVLGCSTAYACVQMLVFSFYFSSSSPCLGPELHRPQWQRRLPLLQTCEGRLQIDQFYRRSRRIWPSQVFSTMSYRLFFGADFQCHMAVFRTHDSFLDDASLAATTGKSSVHGVKGLSDILFFDVIRSCSNDSLHNWFQGLVKKLVDSF